MCLIVTNLFHPSIIAKIDQAMHEAAKQSKANGNYGCYSVLNRNGKIILTVWHFRGKMALNLLGKISGFSFDDMTQTKPFIDITETVKLALCFVTTDLLNIEVQNNRPALLANQWDYLPINSKEVLSCL